MDPTYNFVCANPICSLGSDPKPSLGMNRFTCFVCDYHLCNNCVANFFARGERRASSAAKDKSQEEKAPPTSPQHVLVAIDESPPGYSECMNRKLPGLEAEVE